MDINQSYEAVLSLCNRQKDLYTVIVDEDYVYISITKTIFERQNSIFISSEMFDSFLQASTKTTSRIVYNIYIIVSGGLTKLEQALSNGNNRFIYR